MSTANLIATLATEFAAIFLFILVFGYLLPCGQSYYAYFVRTDPEKERRRIQERRPTKRGIRREVKLSLQTIAIFSILGTGLFEMYKAGMTSIYRDITLYGLWYLPLSFFLCLVIHDTFFYWTHRFMHWRPVFKYFHAGHHKSVSPSPWAIYAFQPAEAITQFLGIIMIVVFLPLHPLVLLAFLSYDTVVNVAGHTGFEMVPKWISQRRFFKGFNTVTHHDNHHTNMRVNFGAFFNVWDRWMGTFLDDQATTVSEDSVRQTPAAESEATEHKTIRIDRAPGYRTPAPRPRRGVSPERSLGDH